MGSHICPDCGDQVVAAPGVTHHCRVLERRRFEAELARAQASPRLAYSAALEQTFAELPTEDLLRVVAASMHELSHRETPKPLDLDELAHEMKVAIAELHRAGLP
jgi:hypothetical protein